MTLLDKKNEVDGMLNIIDYRDEYEEGWLRCRVLAYLHTYINV